MCAASSTVTIDVKLADIKLESSEAFNLPKYEEKKICFRVLKLLTIFCKNTVLNNFMPISETFFYL